MNVVFVQPFFPRSQRDGVISGYSAVEELQQQLGEWVLNTVGRTLGVCAS
jgi:hypothetical protein